MTIFGRHRSVSSSRDTAKGDPARRKARRQEFQRRALFAETLEERAVMDGNGLNLIRNPFWNIQQPRDVNADGQVTAFDALRIINELNLRGARSLASSGTSAGEGQSTTQPAYIDVNNDNRVTAMDALQVINRLNSSAGEGGPLLKLTVQIVAPGTNDDIATVNKGDFYEVRVLTEDLGMLSYMGETRPATHPTTGDDLLGVATTFFDLNYPTQLTQFQVNEVQNINITSGTNGGTFKLTVNDNGTPKTTGDIVLAANRDTVTTNIQEALDTILGNHVVEVTRGTGTTNWRVRFINRLSDRDMPEITATKNASLGASAVITVTEVLQGLPSNPLAVADALRNPRPFFDTDGNALNEDPPFFTDQRAGSAVSTGLNDIGGSNLQEPYQGKAPTEVLRLRFTALDAGTAKFDLSLDDIQTGLETGLLGFNNAITTDLIMITDDSITITEKLSAIEDKATITEGDTTPFNINVTKNDINNPPTPSTTKTIVSIDTTGTSGKVSKLDSSTVTYTPPGGDVSGTDVFHYTVTDANGNTDIGTVTITINPVNDAPVVNGPTSQTFNEEANRVFSSIGGNAITISDVDAGSNTLTVTLNVGAGNGTLSFGGTTGLTGVTNNASSITATGSLTDLNNALNGLTYIPATNLAGNAAATLAISVNDNGNTGGPAQIGTRNITLNLNPVNDAPAVSTSGYTITPQVTEGEQLVLSTANDTRLAVSDIDSGASPVVVTLSVAAGNQLNVPTAAGTVLIGGNNTNTVTLTGPVADVNAALDGIIYTPGIGFGGSTESLQITINDQGNTGGGALSDTKSVSITVDTAVRPRARNDNASVDEDSIDNSIDVMYGTTPGANADLVNTGALPRLLSFQSVTAQGGLVELDPGPTGSDTDDKLLYTPPSNYSGPDSFTYTMNDNSMLGKDSIGTVNITVREMNDAPDAVNDPLASSIEDSGPRTIPFATLLANDSKGPPSESGQTLTITSVTSGVGGTAKIVGTDVIFTPDADFNGPASFTYTIRDNGKTNGVDDFKTDSATASFTITEVNDEPVANPSPLVLTPNPNPYLEDSGALTIPGADLLAGDTPGGGADEATQSVTLQSVTSGAGGTVAIVGSDVIFTPQADFNGTATFTYTIIDNGTTNGVPAPLTRTTNVSFTVTAVNDQPDADDDTAPPTGEEQAVDILVLANDSDVDASTTTFVPVEGLVSPGTTIHIITPPTPTQGTAVVSGNAIRFTPAPGFFGNYSFTYQLNDHSGAANQLSAVATVTGTVLERNDPPTVANDPGQVTDEDTVLEIDVLANDNDPDTAKDKWSFILVTPPAHGDVEFNTTTRLVEYTPDDDYNGTDSFVYKVNDKSPINPQNLESTNTALVSITVREINDAPIANDDNDVSTGDPYIVIADRDREFTAAELLANDSPGAPANESGQSLTITGVSALSAENGTVTLSGGVITYTPAPGFDGTDSFTYTITDNGTSRGVADPLTATGTVHIEVVTFIPTDVVGYVYVDANNNGVFDANERALAGVEVTLAGTSEITGLPITATTKTTNADGYYEFLGVQPGTYTLTESQPFALRDGKDTAGVAASLSGANDTINLILPLLGIPGDVSVNNFGELGVDAGQLTNSAGLTSELLASSTSTGFVLATTLQGDMFWSWALNGWAGCDGITVTLDSDLSAATLEATHNGTTYTTRIFQNPYDTRNANRPTTSPAPLSNLARFRILGNDANGNYIIRLDGRAEHFYGVGTPLAFDANVMQAAEAASAGEYVEGVDETMAEWA